MHDLKKNVDVTRILKKRIAKILTSIFCSIHTSKGKQKLTDETRSCGLRTI